MASREETQSKPPGRPLGTPLHTVSASSELLARWPAEVTELRRRLADAEQLLRQTQAELQDTRERLRSALADRTRMESRLRETERRFQLMDESIPFGEWMCDAEGSLEYASPSFLELTQMNLEELRGFGWTRRLPPEDVEPLMRRWKSHLKTAETWEAEYRILGPDGQYRTVLSRGKPIFDENGAITCWVGIHLDITARKQVEMNLAEHVRKLARSNAELEQFASAVSHDLRAPLTSIGGCAHLLKEMIADRLEPEASEFLDNIHESVLHMGRLIKSLLTYARLGKQGLKLTDCPIERVLTSVLVDLRSAVEAVNARITHDPLPVVRADEALLGQLFQNLLENAIKYRGQDPPLVHIGVRPSENQWFFSVRDNGIGIDQQHFERIFLIFQRLHNDESRYPGLGVGLATCKKIVEQHGGQIWLESTAGAGSIFPFTLPKK